MLKKYFGTDGIRGEVNGKKINGEMFFKFGLAAGTYFKNLKKNKQTAVIAKDTRLSGYTLEPALVSGLASAGMHVFTLGPLPTNGLAMLTKKMRANLGIMITASHNPYHDNGLKLFGPDGLKLSDKIEKKIEKLIDSKIVKNLTLPKNLGRVKRLENATDDYIKISFLIFISFFISLFILSGFLVLDNIGFEKSFKLSILALTNTVNSEMYNLQNINFSNLLTSSKICLIIFMIIGKIELISVFLIFKKILLKD